MMETEILIWLFGFLCGEDACSTTSKSDPSRPLKIALKTPLKPSLRAVFLISKDMKFL